jgi:hypothetical protein
MGVTVSFLLWAGRFPSLPDGHSLPLSGIFMIIHMVVVGLLKTARQITFLSRIITSIYTARFTLVSRLHFPLI